MSMHGRPEGERRPGRQSLTVKSLRAQNRSAALTQLITDGNATRAEIAAASGLSSASATNIVGDLIAEGLVAETGLLASQGGRPTSLLEPVADGAYFIGADVGERGVAVELFDLTMTRVDQEFRGGRIEESPDAIGHDLTDAVEALRQRNLGRWPRVVGVGLGLPGIVETDASGAQTLYAESLGWPPVPVRPAARPRPAAHRRERREDPGEGRAVVRRGARRRARGRRAARTRCGPRGHRRRRGVSRAREQRLRVGPCLHSTAVDRCAAAVGAGASRRSSARRRSSIDGPGSAVRSTAPDGARSASCSTPPMHGDDVASQVVDEVVANLGIALGGLVNLYNPERVIIGGWVGMRLMERLAGRIETATKAAALRRPAEQFSLLPCTFGGDTVAIGAAVMPLESLIAAPLVAEQSRAARSAG